MYFWANDCSQGGQGTKGGSRPHELEKVNAVGLTFVLRIGSQQLQSPIGS
jgi:hypothetical protein